MLDPFRLASDTRMHLIGGTAALAGLLLVLALWMHVHPSVALLVGGGLFAWGIERYQAIRREGTAERRDLLATWFPFMVAAAVVALVDLLA